MMGKNRAEYLFIDFANCRFDLKELLNCINKIPQFFPNIISNKIIKRIKSDFDKTIFKKCCTPTDKFISEWIRPDYKSYIKECESYVTYQPKQALTEEKKEEEWREQVIEGEKRKREFIAERMSIEDCGKEYERLMGMGSAFDKICDIGLTQLKLKNILRKITSSIKLEKKQLDDIETHHGRYLEMVKFQLGKDTYLEKCNSELLSVNGFGLQDKIDLEALIFHELAEFLCTPDWIKLKQCKECEKFFVAKTKKKDQKFCIDKCRFAHANRIRIESGQQAEYMRKKRAEFKYY